MPSSNKEKQKEYDQKRAGQRTRNWTAIVYPDDIEEMWVEILEELQLKFITSPLHDRDLNADGSPKKPHYHVLFMFECVKNKKQVTDLLGELFGWSDSGSVCGVATPQTVSDRCALVRYMAHMDNPSKAQYSVDDIQGHCGADPAELLRYSQTETINMMVSVEEFIEENDIRELCDLSQRIRQAHPDWYTLVATKCTVYFNAFIRSRRHKLNYIEQNMAPDLETGELDEVKLDKA